MESPAHRREFMVDILEGIKVKDAYMKDVLTIPADKTVKEALYFAEKMEHMTYPVVDKDGKMVGITTIMALEKQREEAWHIRMSFWRTFCIRWTRTM
jgi:Mg/Co/Ni transporter MgtE